ncbi:translation initiation factor IF-2 [Candidatus Woesebacteria bacterium]|nr:translation initiation factor IF-2 [Candidatus Woesebacteria bacterium]
MAQQTRPPVVTIMGHVDHGKTTLLDYIRKTQVAAREAGGITQHIGAYSIEFKGKPITFIDTPGHAAFNRMRERGAQVTDIVVLVVAANDGVKPQTIESIRHIKSAEVTPIVAITKIDLPDINMDIAKSGLAEHGITVSDYGGDIDMVPVSATKGTGVDKLLETILITAELMELSADPSAPLQAVVIESSKEIGKGPVATVIVRQGTLSPRQDISTDATDGRVKLLSDAQGKSLQMVGPGFPAEIVGFRDVPAVGAIVFDKNNPPVQQDVEESAVQSVVEGVDFGKMLEENEKQKLNLVVRSDVEGTLEAIMQTLDPDSTRIIASGVGQVTEQDIELADATRSLIVAFNTTVPGKIKKLAKVAGVKIKQYTIIYQLIEELQKQMLKLLEPSIDEVVIGEAEILQIFEMRGERIAGCRIISGEIKRHDLLHLKRNDQVIANPVIKSLMSGKEEIQSVKAKKECGMTFRNRKLDFQVGDHIIAYTTAADDVE